MPVYKKCKAVYAVINLKTLKKVLGLFPYGFRVVLEVGGRSYYQLFLEKKIFLCFWKCYNSHYYPNNTIT